MCDCIKLTNGALQKEGCNTKLEIPLLLSPGLDDISQSQRVIISTVKADSKKRDRPMRLFASFCPFCGKKYPEA